MDTSRMKSRYCSYEERVDYFWSRLEKSTNCWLYQGFLDKSGYGYHNFCNKKWKAHRQAYFLTHGEFDSNFDVCHTCDNPPCCNPDHLWLGKAYDNIHDMLNKGRHPGVVGERNPRAILTNEIVLQIKQLKKEGLRNRDIANRLNVDQYRVSDIVTGRSWTHI